MTTTEVQPGMLKAQIESFADFDKTLTPGKAAKGIMSDLKASSSDLWKVKPQDITVLSGFNPRVQNRAYHEGVEVLAQNMFNHGYMQDKPLAIYSARIDGVDCLVLQDGHRRLAAVLRAIEMGAPIKVVPCVLKERSESMVDLTLALLHSNEGQPFTTFEKAVLAKRLKKFGWENKQIAAEFHCTATFVGQLLTMASAPESVQELVTNGNLSATEMHRLMMEHGAEETERIVKEGVKKAAASGRTKLTAKDLTPSDIKGQRAKKHSYDLYRLLKKYREDPKVEKVITDTDLIKIDEMLADIETKPKVKVEKAPKAAKAPAAKKAAAVKPIKVKSGTDAAKNAENFFNKANKDAAAKKAAKTNGAGPVARRFAAGQRRSDR